MSQAVAEDPDAWAYKVYRVKFNDDDTLTVLVSYAWAEHDHLQMTSEVETMLMLFGNCGRCGLKIDGFDAHQHCMKASGTEHGFIPVVVPGVLFVHVNKEQKREQVRNKSRAANARRRAALDAIGERHSKGDIEQLYSFQDGRCYYCFSALVDDRGNRIFTKDHFVAVMRGGGDGIGNIVLCCRPCNSSKLEMNAEVFRRKMLASATPGDRTALKALHKRHRAVYNPPRPSGPSAIRRRGRARDSP